MSETGNIVPFDRPTDRIVKQASRRPGGGGRDESGGDAGQLGQKLYRPQEVWPYLRQAPRPSPLCPARATLVSLACWVAGEITVQPEQSHGQPEGWQSPAETLWQGAGGCQEVAVVLWSAASLWGLPRGQLLAGTLDGVPHAWVEFPEIGLYADVARGYVAELRHQPPGYQPSLRIYPPDWPPDSGKRNWPPLYATPARWQT